MGYALKIKKLVASTPDVGAPAFFKNPIVSRNFENLLDGCTRKYKQRIRVIIKWLPEDPTVAYTDNRGVVVNAANSLLGEKLSLKERYVGVKGLIVHEMGHILYTDFVSFQNSIDSLLSGKIYPEFKIAKEDLDAYNEFCSYLKDKNKCRVLINIVSNINNILEDGYIEFRVMYEFPGLADDLKFVRKMHWEQLPTLQQMKEAEEEDGNILMSLLQNTLSYAKFGKIKYEPEEIGDERIQTIFNIIPLVDASLNCHNGKKRIEYTYKCIFKLWKYIKPYVDEVSEMMDMEDKLREMMNLSGSSEMGSSSASPMASRDKAPDKEMGSSSARKETRKEAGLSDSSKDDKEETASSSGSGKESEDEKSEETKTGSDAGKSSDNEEEDGDTDSGAGSGNKGEEDDDDCEDCSSGKGSTAADDESDESDGSTDGSDGEGDDSDEYSTSTEGENSDSDGSSDDSDEDKGKASDRDTESRSKFGDPGVCDETGTPARPEIGDSSSDEDDGDETEDFDDEFEEYSAESDFSEAADEISSLMEEIKTLSAEKSLEDERTAALTKEAMSIDYGASHAGRKIKVIRQTVIDERQREAYSENASELETISRRLQRSIEQELRDAQSGGINRGLFMGKKIDCPALIKEDGRYFAKNNLPRDFPQLAVGILVDESGSMRSGQRDTYARATAIILADFCEKLGVPYCLYGHSTYSDYRTENVAMYCYSEFDKIDRNDKYRLMDIQARYNNRDGMANRYVCERLLKRQENTKLFIVISDGLPCADRYYGSGPAKEIQESTKEYQRKGITFVAAAIGDDKEAIHKLYGDAFLDITDLSKMPKLLTNIIKRHVM